MLKSVCLPEANIGDKQSAKKVSVVNATVDNASLKKAPTSTLNAESAEKERSSAPVSELVKDCADLVHSLPTAETVNKLARSELDDLPKQADLDEGLNSKRDQFPNQNNSSYDVTGVSVPELNEESLAGLDEASRSLVKLIAADFRRFGQELIAGIDDWGEAMRRELDELKLQIAAHEKRFSNKLTDDRETEPLYPGSERQVNKMRLRLALGNNKNTFTAFVLQIFTALCSVEDTYRRNLKGRASTTTKGKPKLAFDQTIIDDIYGAVEHYYGEHLKKIEFTSLQERQKFNWRSKVNEQINKKLGQLNRRFEAMKKGEDKSELTEEDLVGFKDYAMYSDDPTAFELLNMEVDDELEKIGKNKKKLKLGKQDGEKKSPKRPASTSSSESSSESSSGNDSSSENSSSDSDDGYARRKSKKKKRSKKDKKKSKKSKKHKDDR